MRTRRCASKRAVSCGLAKVIGTTTLSVVFGCAGESAGPVVSQVASIAITPAADTITTLWLSSHLTAEARDARGRTLNPDSFIWESSDSSVALVDAAGRVTAVGNGTTIVTASVVGATGYCQVTVYQVPTEIVPVVDSVRLTALDAFTQLSAEAFDSKGNLITGRTVHWASNDTAVGTVDDAGIVTALSNGNASIVATVDQLSTAIPLEVRANVRLLWRTDTLEGGIAASPAMTADGRMILGTSRGGLYAIDSGGEEKWRFDTHGRVYSSAAIAADGTIHVGSYDGNVYAINSDGSAKWVFATGAEVLSSPAIGVDGTVYVGSVDQRLYAINPDGSERWQFAAEGTITSSPAIGADGAVYVLSNDGKLHALNADGTARWDLALGSNVNSASAPALAYDGTVYVGSVDAALHAVSPDGTLKWTFATQGEYVGSPTIGPDGTIYFGTSWDGHLYAVYPDGREKWRFAAAPSGELVWHSPAVAANGVIYAGSTLGNLYALDSDGVELWRFTPFISRRRTRLGFSESSPSIDAAGAIYVCAVYWWCYALMPLENASPLANSPWPKFRHDTRNTGNVTTP